jgi:hypothetical protein
MTKVIEVGPDYCPLGVIVNLINANWNFTHYLEKQLDINSRELYLLYNIFLEQERIGKSVSAVFLNELALKVKFSSSCFYFFCNSLVAKDYLSYSELHSRSFYSLTQKGLDTLESAREKLGYNNPKLQHLESCTDHLLSFYK